jgi:integrase
MKANGCSETYRTIVQVAVWSGPRQSEILGLIWSDVDLRAGQVNLSKQLSRARKDAPAERVPLKTGDRRTVEIDPGLCEILRTHKERQFALGFAKPTDYVFCTLPDGKPIHSRNLCKAFAKAADRAGLNPDGKRRLRFHDLRATYVSILIDAGCSLPFIGKQVGHSNPSITLQAYARLFNSAKQAETGLAALVAARGGAS